MKKRFLSILLTVVMVVSMGTGALAAGANDGLRLNLTNSENQAHLDVYLTAEDATNGRITLTYDAGRVRLTDVRAGDDMWVVSINSSRAGYVDFAWVGSNLGGDETLMIALTFSEVYTGAGNGAPFAADVLEVYSSGTEIFLTNSFAEIAGDGTTTTPVIPSVPGTPSQPSTPGTGTGSTGTTTQPDGSTTTTVVNTDGSVTKTTVTPDGTTTTETVDANGQTISVSVEIPESADGETVTLPVEIEVSGNTAAAAPIEIHVPANVNNVTVEIPVEDVTVSSVIVLVHPDGTEEVVPKTVMTDDGLAIEVDGDVVVKVVDNAKDFVDDNTWAADAIAFVTSRELFNGTSETTFSPNETMSRAMLATVLWRMEGKEDASPCDFSDVKAGTWYSDAIDWASEKGIINGYGDSFGTNDAVTREQMITILYRLSGEPAVTTRVGGVSDWAADAMAWAVEVGLIQGDGNGLNAKGTATRAEVATIIMRFMSL